MKVLSGLLTLLITSLLPVTHAAQAVSEFNLDNGLKVLVQEDHRAPVVISQIWYKVGSSSEFSGITGVSHVLEHMMFKGTPEVPSGEFASIIAENGGQQNAFTSRDYTGYYQYLGADRLEIALKLEADRMRNLLLPADEFIKEVNVVKEERMMRTEDNPGALTLERFGAVAYLNSPYRNPPIGWLEDLDSLKVSDLKDWYDAWYRPNNATLVVVGDVKAEDVHQLAKKYFGEIEAGEIPELKPRKETRQRGERRIQVRAPAKLPYVLMGYPVPSLATAEPAEQWEVYALDVMSSVLDGGGGSRFTRDLIRGDEVAASAGAGYSLSYKYQTLFLFDGKPAKGRTIEEVEAALLAQIERIKTEPVEQDELDRIKTQVITGEIYQQDSIQHQANQLGVLETVGLGWQLSRQYADKIRAVTPVQIMKVAKKYLLIENRTVANLIPLDIESGEPKS